MLALSFLCLLLLAYGLLFSLINFYTNYDTSAKYFGPFLIALCLMAGVDIWIMPEVTSADDKLYWQRVLHLIACICLITSYHQTLLVAKRYQPRLSQFVGAFVILLACLMFTDNMLYLSDGQVKGGWGYYGLFFPFAIWYLGFFFFAVLQRLKMGSPSEKKLLHVHLYGFMVVGVFGLVDMAQFLRPQGATFPVYKIIGILIYGLSIAIIFAERFVGILRDRDTTLVKLQAAYRDLEQANRLKQIGESTAIINHEIKNYMFMISGNAQLLAEIEPLTHKGQEMVQNILSSVNRLSHFSRDILELSRTHVTDDKHLINLSQLVRSLTQSQYASHLEKFRLMGFETDHWIHGDWGKIEQALVNLINNSLEASSPETPLQVTLRMHTTPNVVMLTLEDNGMGCDEQQMRDFFKAFVTTKKSKGGTGLGLSITRNIIEGHGGRISAYSKNLSQNAGHGMKIHLIFPNYQADMVHVEFKAPVVVAQRDMPLLADLIRVFQNVGVSPHMVQDLSEIPHLGLEAKSFAVVASTKAAMGDPKSSHQFPRMCLISEFRGTLQVMDPAYSRLPQPFSEEYVLSALMKESSKKRAQERNVHLASALR